MQLLHLLNSGPQIYSSVLSALKDFDFNHEARKMDVTMPKYLVNQLVALERNVRRSEELRLCTDEMITKANAIVDSESAPFENGGSVHYEDMFSFSASTLSRPDLAATWPAFLAENVRTLEAIKSEPGTEHEVTRICLLVAEVMKKQQAGKGLNSKGPVLKVFKSMQNMSPGLSTLFHAVQRVYNPSRKKNSGSSSMNAEDSFSNGSTRKGLRRRKPMKNRANPRRNPDMQQNSTKKRQQQAS